MRYVWFLFIFISGSVLSQKIADGKWWLNETGRHYLKATVASQFWLRSGRYNPGTAVFGYPVSGGTDTGIRRFRMQLFGQLSDRVFFYSQFGINNFNSISDRKPSFFVHDINGEYAVLPERLSLGIGLSGWSGLARFSSPAVASIVGIDAPLYQQTTNDATDQFLRKLGVFAKGKWGRLDYRFHVAQPMSVQKSLLYSEIITERSSFSGAPPRWQWNGYIQLQFLDKESNATPYMTGTYLGKKRVLNLGAGFQYQPKAMWSRNLTTPDTMYHRMLHLGADVYYDAPAGKEGQAIHAYACWSHLDYGPGYIRNLGVMNPVNGSLQPDVVNGGGFGLPLYGTGHVFYVQAGYKMKDSLLGTATFLPYISWQRSSYERLSRPVHYTSSGITLLLKGHSSKVTVAYENRPVFFSDNSNTLRRGVWILQYQLFY